MVSPERPEATSRPSGQAIPTQAPSASASSAPSSPVPTISLPKGGGAIQGIGEKFSTNLATGTASLSIPIATSPGRSGFGPRLGLSYGSGVGNGPFGLGWSLSVPAITRKTDKGLPQYHDAIESAVYVLAGAEDLVPGRGPLDLSTRDGYHIQRYRPRVEGLFARIERWTLDATGAVHWRVITRDNVTSLYGRSPDAQIADPATPGHVFAWLLEETRDDRGNASVFTYKKEDGAGVEPTELSEFSRFERRPDETSRFLATAQRYLSRRPSGQAGLCNTLGRNRL